jgi:hypothetical protein
MNNVYEILVYFFSLTFEWAMCKNHFCNPSYRDIHSFVVVTCCSLENLILSFVEAYLHLKEFDQLGCAW